MAQRLRAVFNNDNRFTMLTIRNKTVAPTALAILIASSSLLQPNVSLASPDSSLELLRKMSVAADSLDYTGEFVYVKDGKISSMKISHLQARGDSASEQKLMALDGSMREIIQQGDEVACVLPDEGMGLREKRQSTQPFKLNISDKTDDIERYYELHLAGQSRVANRDCNLLEVKPRDDYRYGYQLCIDKENSLLLQSELSSQDGSLLESYMFVNIEFDNTDISDIESHTPVKQLKWMDDSNASNHDPMQKEGSVQKWRVLDNASGFELEQYIERVSPVLQADVTHLVLGDGLAKVSVFVAPAKSSANKSKKSLSMGSLNSYTLELGDYMITVIGEVPQSTVAIIAKATEMVAQ